MNTIIKIIGILLLFMVLKAEKCSDQTENSVHETQINYMRKEIKSHFDAGFLSESSLNEHEKAARHKLDDFADYLGILEDSSLLKPYREKAGEMILNLFTSDTVRVKIISGRDWKSQEFSVGQLIQSGLENKLFISGMVYDSVQVTRNFSRTSPDSYSAILSFIENRYNTRDFTFSGAPCHRKIHAQINKETKIFAADTLSVWVLRLGEME